MLKLWGGQGNYSFAEVYDSNYGDQGVLYMGIEDTQASVKIVMITFGGVQYSWFCDDTTATVWNTVMNTSVEANKWYVQGQNGYTLYSGTGSPISLASFADGTIYSTSYLNRVINSF